MGIGPAKNMRHGENPRMDSQAEEKSPKSSTAPKFVKVRTGRPRARGRAAKEHEHEMEPLAEVRKE